MEGGFRAITTVLEELLRNAKRDVIITVYLVRNGDLMRQVEDLLSRGVMVHLIFNDWTGQPPPVRRELQSLATKYAGLFVYDFQGRPGQEVLHAKALAVDGSLAMIGSANLSTAAMLWNYELAVTVEGETAEGVSRLLYHLAGSELCRRIIPAES